MELQTRLKEARQRRNLTQDQVGSVLGVAGATVSRWESGALALPAYDLLIRWGETVGLRLQMVVSEPDDPVEALRSLLTREQLDAMVLALNSVKKVSWGIYVRRKPWHPTPHVGRRDAQPFPDHHQIRPDRSPQSGP